MYIFLNDLRACSITTCVSRFIWILISGSMAKRQKIPITFYNGPVIKTFNCLKIKLIGEVPKLPQVTLISAHGVCMKDYPFSLLDKHTNYAKQETSCAVTVLCFSGAICILRTKWKIGWNTNIGVMIQIYNTNVVPWIYKYIILLHVYGTMGVRTNSNLFQCHVWFQNWTNNQSTWQYDLFLIQKIIWAQSSISLTNVIYISNIARYMKYIWIK